MAVGNRRLMERDGIDLAAVADHRQHLAEGRTALIVAVDGQAVGLFGTPTRPASPRRRLWRSWPASASRW